MAISIFDGSNQDAYWWVLCTEKHFKTNNTSEAVKVVEAVVALRGCALHWWLLWSHRHPTSSWDTLTTALLWRFKPEWRDILPIFDEDEAPDSNSLISTEADSESSNSVVAPSLNDDPNANQVSDIVDEPKDVEPPSIPKQEQLCSPPFEPSPPQIEITGSKDVFSRIRLDSFDGSVVVRSTIPERRSKCRGSHDVANFVLHHSCLMHLPYGNDSTNRAPAPPPKPPDRRFSTMLSPPFFSETIMAPRTNSSLAPVFPHQLQKHSPPFDQRWPPFAPSELSPLMVILAALFNTPTVQHVFLQLFSKTEIYAFPIHDPTVAFSGHHSQSHELHRLFFTQSEPLKGSQLDWTFGLCASSYWLLKLPWELYRALLSIKDIYGNPPVILSANDMSIFQEMCLKQHTRWKSKFVLVQVAYDRGRGKDVQAVQIETKAMVQWTIESVRRYDSDFILLIKELLEFYEQVANPLVIEHCLVIAVMDGINVIPFVICNHDHFKFSFLVSEGPPPKPPIPVSHKYAYSLVMFAHPPQACDYSLFLNDFDLDLCGKDSGEIARQVLREILLNLSNY